jgi:DNA-binding MarR family transcriptional regulator
VPESEPLAELLTTAGRFIRLAGALTSSDLPHAVVRALAILEENGDLRITEFARIDRCSQPAATALIARLTERGLVERRKDPADSRAVVVGLTEDGRAQLSTARQAAADALAPYLSDVETDDITTVLAGLNRLVEALGRKNP